MTGAGYAGFVRVNRTSTALLLRTAGILFILLSVEMSTTPDVLRVLRPDYKIWTETFIIVAGETQVISVALEPLEDQRPTDPM